MNIEINNESESDLAKLNTKLKFYVPKPKFSLKTLKMPLLLFQNIASLCKGK